MNDQKIKASVKGTPQIYHYLRKYQQDPTSRIFAPLAEAYRKAGLIQEAIEIARDGLRIHPHFVGGRVALARALFDQSKYGEVIKELEPVVLDAPDNIIAQKLLAESYLIQGRVVEALNSYKVLLFLLPQDSEVAKMVQEIEQKAYEDGTLVLQKDQRVPVRNFTVKGAFEAISQDPEVKRHEWIKKVEVLQGMLLRIERIRLAKKA